MWTLLLLATFLLLLLLISRSKKSGGQLQKLDFLPDVVYLVQFPVSPFIRSISPFALKLETYLRLKKVKYEPVYSLHFGKKRQIPYVEINGEHIPDSNVIIKELEKRGIATPDDHLSQEQKAANHVASICIENHTCLAGFLWRYGAHMEEFYGKLCEANFGKARDLFFFKHFMPFGMRLKGKFHGLGRHSPEEIQEFSFQDLKAISVMLGDKPYFNGQEPSTFDCTAFGHLVQFVYMPMDIPQKKFILESCPNLVKFVDRMRNRFWPDWEVMCLKACMIGRTAKSVVLD